MNHYGPNDPHEREPLDSGTYYDVPSSVRRPMPPQHQYSDQTSPYHDSEAAMPSRYQQEPAPYGRAEEHDYGRGYYEPSGSRYDYSDQTPPSVPPHGDNSYYAGAGRTDQSRRRDQAAAPMAPAGAGYASDQAYHDGYHGHTGLPPPPSRTASNNYPRQHQQRQRSHHDPYAVGGAAGYGYDSHGYNQAPVSRGDSYNNLAAVGNSPYGSRSPSHRGDGYDDPFRTPRATTTRLGEINPHELADDGDDGLNGFRPSNRNSMLSSHNSDRAARRGAAAAPAAAGAAAAGGYMSARGRDSEGVYDLGSAREKPKPKSKKWKWVVIVVVAIVIIGAIVGGILGGLVFKGGADDSSSDGRKGQSAKDDLETNGDLGKSSPEIKKLLDNKDLHKVFPGMDYTPMNTQYPFCIHDPPSQNNVTRDIAVLSQLTNKVRLYGTDCNQTQMVLHAIDRLDLKNDMKVWLGVWQDDNSTTNSRQLEQMWDVLDEYGEDPFEGIIVANEIIFREEMTITELAKVLDGVRSKLKEKNIDLPVATSDLGDDWTTELAQDSDYIMANIHPFFAGEPAKTAADWAYHFWSVNDKPFWKADKKKNIVAEVGWPTGGGTNCGGAESCAEGSVASVDGLNQLMEDWVCQALKNETQYFWFSSFDEPWKDSFNEKDKGREWEDKWGLMDVNRELKKGVKIPDCSGQSVDSISAFSL